jgi:UDP-N-acetylmuramate-alanine ligase
VALGTHFHPNLGLGGAGMNDLAAVTRDRGIDVFGMNASLHGPPPV